MYTEIFTKVKEFLIKLVKDQSFRNQLENSSDDERNKFLQASGFSFSKEEFETGVINVLEAKEKGGIEELTDEELVAVVGGFARKPPYIQPMYGVVVEPPLKPPYPQPMYGVIWDEVQ